MTRKGQSIAAGVLAAGALLTAGGTASAQVPPAAPAPQASPPPDEAASAAELRAKGKQAAAAGQPEACIEAYTAALRAEPDGLTAGELGLCEEALGRNVAAYDHLRQALEREVPTAPPAVRERWSRFHAAFLRVERRVALVVLAVLPAHAEVFLDGVPRGPYASGRFFAVAPGTHTWTARLPGYPDVVVEHTVSGGDIPDIALYFHGWLPPSVEEHWPPPRSPPRSPPPVSSCAHCAPPLAVPCAAADDLPMSVDLCNALKVRWRRMDPTLGLVAGGLLTLGFTPDVGPGFFVGGEAHWRRQGQVEDWGFQAGAEARFVMPTYGGTTLNGGRHISIALLELAIVPCVRYKWALGCAVVSPGMTLAGGTLFESPEAKDGAPAPLFMLGVGPRLGVDFPVLERFGVRLFGELRFAPLPPGGYRPNGVYYVWQEPIVSGVVGLAAAYR